MQLSKILSMIPFFSANKPLQGNETIQQIRTDHRFIQHGDMFVCIKGFTVDGHQFANEAVANGATVIVTEKRLNIDDVITITVPNTNRALALLASSYYNFPTKELPLIGITGTNGKTTITYLLDHIFRMAKLKTGVIGTIQVKIGDETQPVQNTTPNALRLQGIFGEMINSDVEIAMMEVSSHALELGRVNGCNFDIAVFTNLTQDHLDFHENMNDYLRAKTLLFTGLGNGYQSLKKFAVLNWDDPNSRKIAKSTSQPIITYGLNTNADVMATDIHFHVKGVNFTLVTPNRKVAIKSKLMGKFNVYNMLAAVTVAILRNISLDTIQQALESMAGVPGRFEQVDIGQDYAVIVDYAHTPDSLENVLAAIGEFKNGKVYVVVGTGGDRDRTKRPLMANTAVKHGDWAIFTTDNPRTEDPRHILQDMTKNINVSNYEVIENRKLAIEKAVGLARTGDVILIAGKGHETYQEVNGIRYDFDDRLVAREAIEQRGIR